MPRVECIAIPTNDAWARDYAPTFVVGAETPGAAPELAAVDWHYNAWGGKYPPFDDDQRVVRRVARQGAANAGLTVSRASLLPEVCVTAEGVWWHPVAAADPAMKVADDWHPLAETIHKVRDEYRAHRIAGDVLASTFPCA